MIIDEHEEWIKSNGKRGKRLELYDTDLTLQNLDLEDRNLSLASIRHCNLKGLDLTRTSFDFGDLTGSDIRGCNIFETSMVGTYIFDIKLDYIDIDRKELIRKLAYSLDNYPHINRSVAQWVCSITEKGKDLENKYGSDMASLLLLGNELWYNIMYSNKKDMWEYISYKLECC